MLNADTITLTDLGIMPPPYRYILWDGVTQLETVPVNKEEYELGLVRDGLTLNREITAELKFCGAARDYILDVRLGNRELVLCLYNRTSSWEMALKSLVMADFESFTDDMISVSLSFTENSVQKDLTNNSSIDYDIPIPYRLDGVIDSEAKILKYRGINRDRTNRLSCSFGSWQQLPSTSLYKTLPSFRTTSIPSTKFTFNENFMQATCTTAGEVNIAFKVGVIKTKVGFASSPILCVGRSRAGKVTILTDVSNPEVPRPCEFMPSPLGIEYVSTLDWRSLYLYTWLSEVSIVDTAEVGDIYFMAFKSSDWKGEVLTARDCYFKVTAIEESTFVNYEIPVISYQSLITKILAKISPLATLTYNLPDVSQDLNTENRVSMLGSSTALYRSYSPVITANFDNLMKALKCEYGADYIVNGNEVIIDYQSTLFPNEAGITITPTSRPVRTYDPTHVYNSVKVGWESDTNVVNGTLEYNCTNTFKIQGKGDKMLELIHPFKGSPYTIEQFLIDKKSDSTEVKQSDTDIFVFVCQPFKTELGAATQYSILQRGTLTSNLPLNAYNVQLTPSRMLIANGKYLGISTWGIPNQVEFTSTEIKADYHSKFSYESEIIYENDTNGILESEMAQRLFTPDTLEFDTSIEEVEVTPSHIGAYKYFTIVGKNNEYSYNIRIKDITLRQTGKASQQWVTWIK